jgi:hypothetical protein
LRWRKKTAPHGGAVTPERLPVIRFLSAANILPGGNGTERSRMPSGAHGLRLAVDVTRHLGGHGAILRWAPETLFLSFGDFNAIQPPAEMTALPPRTRAMGWPAGGRFSL